MKPLPQNYDHKIVEKKWQKYWETENIYKWRDDQSRKETFVIDTPPPTVSGVLHMGHIFSYTQADFVARYMRMRGKDVFYPMGFDDNGLPTERLVEKVKKVRANDMSREAFIELCEGVSFDARKEFRHLFESVALSVDWNQEYHTISSESRRISQLSFLDLFNKGCVYRKLQPMLWDPIDQTALSQADIEDKELPSNMNYILFDLENGRSPHPKPPLPAGEGIVSPSPRLRGEVGRGAAAEKSAALNNPQATQYIISESLPSTQARSPHPNPPPQAGEGIRVYPPQVGEGIKAVVIATTRPELLGACVAVFYHPDDARYQHLEGQYAITPLFGVRVPLLADENVKIEKGTGLVMCCTFGDEMDIAWWRTHDLPTRVILNKYGKVEISHIGEDPDIHAIDFPSDAASASGSNQITASNCLDIQKAFSIFQKIQNKKISNPDPKSPGAREIIINLLKEDSLLIKQEPITHAVKCAERSGSPLEILPTHQWFIKILDQKEQLKEKAKECNWHPEYMRTRINQWIDGLSWDWCISRQRYFGVPFPVWYSKRKGEEGRIILPNPANLPVNPLTDLPDGYSRDEVQAEADVMDTWATSSVSPQLSSKAITKDYAIDYARHKKLFPADLRPQAHEIIRTWAFYTIVKAHLHEDSIPWKNLMISGWCLASDKSKMSKSKGNVITPVDLIEEKGADVVRFWASTSRLGSDTAFSEDVLKIGKKLVTKLWNATKFAAIHLDKITEKPGTALEDVASKIITQPLDLWILTRLKRAINIATQEFDKYEYCDARVAAEDFFWNDFCDNYLELVKGRVYGQSTPYNSLVSLEQKSAIYTIYHCLDGILRLLAPIVPHITDELYTHIFDNKIINGDSIHSRGNWPEAADYPDNPAFEQAGIATVSVLNAVRKLKAQRGVSIKWPLHFININGDGAAEQLSEFAYDLKNVTSAEKINFTENPAAGDQILTIKTDDGKFEVTASFAENASSSEAV